MTEDGGPIPEQKRERLERQLAFIREIDKLTSVVVRNLAPPENVVIGDLNDVYTLVACGPNSGQPRCLLCSSSPKRGGEFATR